MKLIVYKKKIESDEQTLRMYFASLLSEGDVEMFSSIEALRCRITKMLNSDVILVLVVKNKSELTDFVPIIDLFRSLRIILILPDRKPETIRIGYQLEPRFLSFIDKGYAEVKAVLKKMLDSLYAVGESARII